MYWHCVQALQHDEKSEIISTVAKELRSRKQNRKIFNDDILAVISYLIDWWANSVISIVTARVPIVKMKLMQRLVSMCCQSVRIVSIDRWDELECDISMGNYLVRDHHEPAYCISCVKTNVGTS